MKHRSREWYIHEATRAARESVDPVERGKHTKIMLDMHMIGFNGKDHVYRSSSEFLELAYRGREQPPNVAMAWRAINYLTFTDKSYERMVYVGRHTDSDPAFVLSHITNRYGPALRPPVTLSVDHAHRAVAIDEQHVQPIIAVNADALIVADAVPIVRGRFDYAAEYPRWFTQDDESPTDIIVGRKAIGEWAAVMQDGEGVAAEYAAQVHTALQQTAPL